MFLSPPLPYSSAYNRDNWRSETSRFHQAQQTAIHELNEFYIRARDEVGEAVASIFKIHSMLLEDRNYVETFAPSFRTRGNSGVRCSNGGGEFCFRFLLHGQPLHAGQGGGHPRHLPSVILVLMGDRQELTMAEPAILVADRSCPVK